MGGLETLRKPLSESFEILKNPLHTPKNPRSGILNFGWFVVASWPKPRHLCAPGGTLVEKGDWKTVYSGSV